MLHIFNTQDSHASARAMQKYLKKLNLVISLNQAYDVLAVMSGKSNWASLKQSLSAEAVDALLLPMCQSHIVQSEGDTYGNEFAMVGHNGFELRYPQGDVDYVRVCDPLGRELAYWVSDEWEDDPVVVMGAILGAFGHRQELKLQDNVPEKQSRTSRKAGSREPKVSRDIQPTIASVPLDKVSAVVWDMEYREVSPVHENLHLLASEPDEFDDEIAVFLFDDESGIISLAQLRNMRWHPVKHIFFTDDGSDVNFIISQPFGTYIQNSGDMAVSPSVSDVAGPFSVYADGGHYNTVDKFSDAVDIAIAIEPTAEVSVEVRNNQKSVVWTMAALGSEG